MAARDAGELAIEVLGPDGRRAWIKPGSVLRVPSGGRGDGAAARVVLVGDRLIVEVVGAAEAARSTLS